MKLEEKDIKKLERVMRKHRISSVDELIAVIERGQRFGKHGGGRPRTITDEQRRQIIDAKQRGATLQAVADRHGVSVSTVKNILREHKARQQPPTPLQMSTPAREVESAAVKMRLYDHINEAFGHCLTASSTELEQAIRCDAVELIRAIKDLVSDEKIIMSRKLIGDEVTGEMIYYLRIKRT